MAGMDLRCESSSEGLYGLVMEQLCSGRNQIVFNVSGGGSARILYVKTSKSCSCRCDETSCVCLL